MATCDTFPESGGPCGPAFAGLPMYRTNGQITLTDFLLTYVNGTQNVVENFSNDTKFRCPATNALTTAVESSMRYQVSMFCAKLVQDAAANNCPNAAAFASPQPQFAICEENMNLAVDTFFGVVNNLQICPSTDYAVSQFPIYDTLRTRNNAVARANPTTCIPGVPADAQLCGFKSAKAFLEGCETATDACCTAFRRQRDAPSTSASPSSSGAATSRPTSNTVTSAPAASNPSTSTSGAVGSAGGSGSGSSSSNLGAIIGGIVGGLAAIGIIIALAIIFLRRRRPANNRYDEGPYKPAAALGASSSAYPNQGGYNTNLQSVPYASDKDAGVSRYPPAGSAYKPSSPTSPKQQAYATSPYSSLSRGQAGQGAAPGAAIGSLSRYNTANKGSNPNSAVPDGAAPVQYGSMGRKATYNSLGRSGGAGTAGDIDTTPRRRPSEAYARLVSAAPAAGPMSPVVNPVVAALATLAPERDSVATDLTTETTTPDAAAIAAGEDDDQSVIDSSTMRVIHPYAATLPDELELRLGEVVILLRSFDDGWGLGLDPRTGAQGAFPLVCVVSVREAGARPPSQQHPNRFSKRVSSAMFTAEQIEQFRPQGKPPATAAGQKQKQQGGPPPLPPASTKPMVASAAPRSNAPVATAPKVNDSEYLRSAGYDPALDEGLPSAASVPTTPGYPSYIGTPSVLGDAVVAVPPVPAVPGAGPQGPQHPGVATLKRGVKFASGAPVMHVYPAARDSVASSMVSSSTAESSN
ncbi:hypothetical protein HDU96_010981 [Phlyctochytrium bullatum]|nr:hypothetical protein HDU96_010981 [Phlyctochytrium bullatum]